MSFIALQTCYLQLKTINFIARLNTPRFPYIFSNKHCDFVGLITPNLIVNFFEKAAPFTNRAALSFSARLPLPFGLF